MATLSLQDLVRGIYEKFTSGNSGTDIGDVTINNAAGAGVYVQPGTSATWGLAAGTNFIGTVGASDGVITVTPTLDTNAYASGDLLFDSTEVPAAVRVAGGTAILESITILDKAGQGVPFTIVFANAATDFGTLNAAPDPDDTEAATAVGFVAVAATDYIDLGASKLGCVKNIGLEMKAAAAAAATSLWIAGINGTGTPTFAASDLVITLGFLRA